MNYITLMIFHIEKTMSRASIISRTFQFENKLWTFSNFLVNPWKKLDDSEHLTLAKGYTCICNFTAIEKSISWLSFENCVSQNDVTQFSIFFHLYDRFQRNFHQNNTIGTENKSISLPLKCTTTSHFTKSNILAIIKPTSTKCSPWMWCLYRNCHVSVCWPSFLYP